MQLLFRHKLLITGVTVLAAASAGGAYAATQSGNESQQALINDVAKRLNVSPTQLTSAVKGALIDRINAELKAGQITKAQANRLEQRIENGRLPFFFGARGAQFGPAGPLHGPSATVHVAAGYLGLTDAQLLADLRSGKSLAQVATAHGKSVSGLEQTLFSAETKRLNQLRSAGLITKAQEQRVLSRLSARIGRLVTRTGFGRLAEAPRFAQPGGPRPEGGPMIPPAGLPAIPPGGSAPPPPAA